MMRSVGLRAMSFACLWWMLSEGRNDGWLLGVIAVAAGTAASIVLWPPSGGNGIRLAALPGFLAFFLAGSLRGGWQVALMALRGRDALRPAFLELPLNLPPGVQQILLTNMLSLMPGTSGVRLADDLLCVHVLHADLPIATEARMLERHIAALFGGNA